MPAYRYYIDAKFVDKGTFALIGQELHHFQKVMRGRVGDSIELINGHNQLAFAQVIDLNRKEASVLISHIETGKISEFRYIVAQAIAKPNRLESVIEKCTELGASEFWLFPSERSEKESLSSSQLERLFYVMVSAIKQCGRLDLPKLILTSKFKEWQLDPTTNLYFGDVSKEAVSFHLTLAEKREKNSKLLFLTGPESGFSEAECDEFKRKHATGVKLHHNILRTDTASIAALIIAQQHYGDSPEC